MKAVVCTQYGPPDVLEIRDVEAPVPRSREVRIKVIATGVTASDCIIRGFSVSRGLRIPMGIALGFSKPRRPILGMVFSGEIESTGPDAVTYQPGEAVFGCDFDRRRFGMYAEYACVPETAVMALKPTTLTHLKAAALPYGGLLALHYLQRGEVRAGQRVLIYGASGAIGTSAVQIARSMGAEVTGVCSTGNLALVSSLGAARVIDYTREDFTACGERFDLVLNAVGKAKARIEPRPVLTSNGRYATVDDGTPKLDIAHLLLLRELAERGDIRPVIDRCYPLDEIVEAHRYVETGHKRGNVAITVAGEAPQ